MVSFPGFYLYCPQRRQASPARALCLLTMTAEPYAPRFGCAAIAHHAGRADITATLKFRSACPASAVAMARPLVGTPTTT